LRKGSASRHRRFPGLEREVLPTAVQVQVAELIQRVSKVGLGLERPDEVGLGLGGSAGLLMNVGSERESDRIGGVLFEKLGDGFLRPRHVARLERLGHSRHEGLPSTSETPPEPA
jgi:hypothetical protein